ncbi:hypothetical protein [Pseudonocardia asaccharolytica]|uniref:Uncharacterized protein n=1 Tax=Pseudonocardia asaccharolytica DSM 44247 = NBRC 16224 TaxID=1123024 RepID=A0A511D7F3_9PSEU|nr:hypothetical protein [Pseudonocardia asaccharolytica]GEL20706.1 hypothetical protein PA7_45430 [Pseudonocardia asaccharolytica DSM 44247 = NBRC 16224]
MAARQHVSDLQQVDPADSTDRSPSAQHVQLLAALHGPGVDDLKDDVGRERPPVEEAPTDTLLTPS